MLPLANPFFWFKRHQQAKRRVGLIEMIGLLLSMSIILMAVFAPLLSAYQADAVVCKPFLSPTAGHRLGCDDFGHDLWSQLLYGARTSLMIGFSVALLATLVATGLSLIAGYSAGGKDNPYSWAWLDRVIMRGVDVTLALPFLPLVIVLGVYFGSSIRTQILVLSIVMWAQPVRELRAQVLQLRHNGYVEAARSMGAGMGHISLHHLLPDLFSLIVPQFIRIAHNAILVEATLSFLGLGDPLQSSWGSMLYHANARTAFLTGAWTHWVLPPGLAIAATVASLALMGYYFEKTATTQPKKKHNTLKLLENQSAEEMLRIENLWVHYQPGITPVPALKGINLSIKRGEMLGLVGESGCGKSTLAMAILDLWSANVRVQGDIFIQKTGNTERYTRQQIRRHTIALIPQGAMNALNPVLTVGQQLQEVLSLQKNRDSDKRQQEIDYWLQKVGLEPRHARYYPHQLSGGMRQRVVIAIALCKRPLLVIADEPTTGLDVLIQHSILELLMQLKEEMHLTILLITHNLPLVSRYSNRVAVMYQGKIVEIKDSNQLAMAQHPYTKALFSGMLDLSESMTGTAARQENLPTPLLQMCNVSKCFDGGGWLLKRKNKPAVKDVSLALYAGENVALVGGSGAGKSTLAKLLLGMLNPTTGRVLFNGQALTQMSKDERRHFHRKVHWLQQDPYQSLNPRYRIAELIAEPLYINGWRETDKIDAQVIKALQQVHLPYDDAFLQKTAQHLSGGERQRVAIARG